MSLPPYSSDLMVKKRQAAYCSLMPAFSCCTEALCQRTAPPSPQHSPMGQASIGHSLVTWDSTWYKLYTPASSNNAPGSLRHLPAYIMHVHTYLFEPVSNLGPQPASAYSYTLLLSQQLNGFLLPLTVVQFRQIPVNPALFVSRYKNQFWYNKAKLHPQVNF